MLDYNDVMPLLKNVDIDFTTKNGCSCDFEKWDEALERAVIEYNDLYGTAFNPNEAKHLYIESQEVFM